MTDSKKVNILIETGKAGQRFFSKKTQFSWIISTMTIGYTFREENFFTV